MAQKLINYGIYVLLLKFTPQDSSETHFRVQWGLVISKTEDAGLEATEATALFSFWGLVFEFLNEAPPLLSEFPPFGSFVGDKALSFEKT